MTNSPLTPIVHILAINVTPPLSWMLVAFNMLGGASLLMLSKFMGRSDLGWDKGTLWSRVVKFAGGTVLVTNAVVVWMQPVVSLRVMVLGVVLGLIFASDLYDYRRRSMRHADRNAQAARQAYDSLKARGRLPVGAKRP